MVDVCTDGVVMMVMGKDDYDKTCWQQRFGKNTTLQMVLSWWCLSSCWCLGGLSLWAVCPKVLTVFGDVLSLAHVFVVFLWCFGGVLVVIIEEIVLFEPKWLTCQYHIGVNGYKKPLLLGLYAGLVCLNTCFYDNGSYDFYSPHLCWGSCLGFCIPPPPPPSARDLSHTQLCHTHNLSHNSFQTHTQLCHIQLCHTRLCHTYSFTHTQSFTRNLVTHTLSHTIFHTTTLSHTRTQLRHTHAIFHTTTLSHTHAHSFVTHSLSHNKFCTQLCHTHTQLCHAQVCHTHTQLCHAQPVTHTQSFTQQLSHTIFVTRNLSSTHTIFHIQLFYIQLCHIQLCHTHATLSHKSFTQTNLLLDDIRAPVAWQVWDLGTSRLQLRGRHGTVWDLVTSTLSFAWQAWHYGTGWIWWRAWVPQLRGRRATWWRQAWYLVTSMRQLRGRWPLSTLQLRGRRGTYWHPQCYLSATDCLLDLCPSCLACFPQTSCKPFWHVWQKLCASHV